MDTRPVDELNVEEILARAGGNQAALLAAETENYVLAAHYADLHGPESRPADGPSLPGMEKLRRFGVVQVADGRRSRADFQHLVAGKVVAADPDTETAARREAEAPRRTAGSRGRPGPASTG